MLWIPMQIPQEKVGCQAIRLVSHRWSENAAVLFMSNLLENVILYQVGRLGFTGFILQGVYWIMRGLLAQA